MVLLTWTNYTPLHHKQGNSLPWFYWHELTTTLKICLWHNRTFFTPLLAVLFLSKRMNLSPFSCLPLSYRLQSPFKDRFLTLNPQSRMEVSRCSCLSLSVWSPPIPSQGRRSHAILVSLCLTASNPQSRMDFSRCFFLTLSVSPPPIPSQVLTSHAVLVSLYLTASNPQSMMGFSRCSCLLLSVSPPPISSQGWTSLRLFLSLSISPLPISSQEWTSHAVLVSLCLSRGLQSPVKDELLTLFLVPSVCLTGSNLHKTSAGSLPRPHLRVFTHKLKSAPLFYRIPFVTESLVTQILQQELHLWYWMLRWRSYSQMYCSKIKEIVRDLCLARAIFADIWNKK